MLKGDLMTGSHISRRFSLLLFAGVFVASAWCGGGAGKLHRQNSGVKPVDISADSAAVLVTDGAGQGLQIVNGFTGNARKISGGHTAGYGASLSPDASLVAFKQIDPSTGAQSPAIYNSQTNETHLLATAPLAGTPAISGNGRIAFTVGNELRLTDGAGTLIATFDLGHHVNLVAISSDGNKIAYNDQADQIIVINVKTGKQKKVTDDKASYFNPAFSPNGKKLLVQTVDGRVCVTNARRAHVKILGEGDSPGWLDNKTLSFTEKAVIDGIAVTKTDLLAVSIKGKVKGVLASANGDATAVGKGRAIAFSAEAATPAGRGPALANAGGLQVGITSGRQAWTETVPVQLEQSDTDIAPKTVITSGNMVYIDNVPYIHQNNDTPDWWNGNWSCNATAALMAIQYYNILPAHPMTASWPTPHTSDYGWYIPNTYTFNGHTFNKSSTDPNGTTGHGGYGYITQNGWEDTKGHMAEYISYHGPSSSVDWSPTIAKARTEIDNDHPFVILTSITSAGHYPLCIGYISGQHTLVFNDPYGNKNSGSYPSENGRKVRYDWPGYNNGYSNLNTVHCYIWARMTQTTSPDPIVVENTSSNFSASSNWITSSYASDKHGTNYRYRSTASTSDACSWTFNISQAGSYKIYAWWSQGSNRSASAPYILPDGTVVHKNQQTGGGAWRLLDTQYLSTGSHSVLLSCWTTPGYVVIGDAIRVVPNF